jgi:CYTH domain-containing protein
MFFTASTEEALEQTLDQTVSNSSNLSEMPVVPQDFLEMHQMVLNERPDALVTNFKARRIPDLADAEIRPGVDRIVDYSGEDGRQALSEFKQYYGVVPIRVQYEDEDFELKIDKSGKFTLMRSNAPTFNLLFKLIEKIMDHVLDIQEVSERIRFRTERRESGDLELEVGNITAGQIDFNREITLLKAEEFMETASKRETNQFTFTDVTKEAGSLDFSATVTDERRGAHFNISATQDSMKIVPKHNCAFPTIVHFFQIVSETLDERAEINVFDNESAYSSPA